MNREECSERIRLVDEYSRLVTTFNVLLESLKAASVPPADRSDLDIARLRSQEAWNTLEARIAEHHCLELHWSDQTGSDPADLLKAAAMAALDVILVADDQRRLVDLNDAAVVAFELPRNEIIGRKIDEFFSEIRREAVPDAWACFTSRGARKFEYCAKANFAPGLHLGVLREIV